ncbi:hypothetical protein [Deinococcus actinosclerus]|uniref:Uncharacterized protein n=1 Tax=Deinococcus actinosclerus TaxID=1768108 RepID=A0ABN4K4C3_9DEIO|nr:hypothetical protein [Deinococcus actinosclerus]ALW89028.1 hypothetical protein AUC44_09115 [Deinococcus actinosclerus]
MPRWTFRYPRAAVSPSPWGVRVRLALHLLRPQVSWRVGELPAPLRDVHWPAGVSPLGVYRDLAGARHVRLRVPGDPAAQFSAREAVRGALLAAGLPAQPGEAVGFDVREDRFELGDTVLGLGTPQRRHLDLPLITREGEGSLSQPGLSLWGGPRQSSGGAPLLLVPEVGDLQAVLLGWQAEAAAQGWDARPPLCGADQVLLTFTRADGIVTLTGVRLSGAAWAFTLERDAWSHLLRLSTVAA